MTVPLRIDSISPPPDWEDRAPGPRLSPELATALEDLDAGEQDLLAWLVQRAKRGPDGERAQISDVWLVHQFLKMDAERDDLTVLQNINAYTAPPVLKEHLDRDRIDLPTDFLPLPFPLDEVLAKRATRRDFSKGPLSLQELATLLHRSYGIRTRSFAYNVKGFPTRFVPSTGGLQSVEVYLAVNAVEGLEKGIYHYEPGRHCLEVLDRGNFRRKVVRSCLFQDWIDAASVVLFLTCDMSKVYWKYGRRGYRFVHVDAGIVGQTLHLVATSLRLRSCMVAGYIDESVHQLLRIDGRTEFVAFLFAVGRKPWEPGPSHDAPAEPDRPE
jgi:SagB-type dehydrogenase family enzyme